MESSTWLVVAAFILAFFVFRFLKSYRSPRLLRAAAGAIERGAPLIDVRTREEFAAGHHPGALNIPLQELAGRTSGLGAPEQPLVLYCHSGSRSAQASRILKAAGYSQVLDLGPQRNTAGLPEARSTSTKGKIPSSKRRRRR